MADKVDVEFTEQKCAEDHILKYFSYKHLPENLANISRPFAMMANTIVTKLPRNPERTAALRKLLEAKDCAVRCILG